MTGHRVSLIVGYAKAGGADVPTVEAQEADLRAAGARRIFSGADGLVECMAYLRDGDLLAVTTPDRLATGPGALLALETDLARRGIGLAVLSIAGQMVEFANPATRPLVVTLAAIAAWQRTAFADRQRAGIAAARDAGVYRGGVARIPAEDVRAKLRSGTKAAKVAREFGIARSSVYRLAVVRSGSTPSGQSYRQ